jgi:Protein of unknown function (DUF3309)
MGTILLIVLILLLVGALPTWPYSSGWGYYPSGGLGLILLILLILLLMGPDITPSGTVLDKSVGGHRFVTRVFSLGDDSYKAKFFRNAD